MTIPFPSLEYFQALQQRTREDSDIFEKLGVCDVDFGAKVGERMFSVRFEVCECVEVREGGDPTALDFVLAGPPEIWREMLQAIAQHGGADAAHTLNTLTHVGNQIQVEAQDAEGSDKLFRYMASIQEFFDQGRHLEIAFD
ncbi:MAG: hypothetical protein OXU53_01895 [Deltaproteobacteria bacterium]|nr:hypothetical protein [Deltaproteobacteria bacterium]